MKRVRVFFVNNKLNKKFQKLKDKSPESDLCKQVIKSRNDLLEGKSIGVKVSRKLWPKEYLQHEIDNLWKHNLSKSDRLIYTIKGTDIVQIIIILDWLTHKEYERKFKY